MNPKMNIQFKFPPTQVDSVRLNKLKTILTDWMVLVVNTVIIVSSFPSVNSVLTPLFFPDFSKFPKRKGPVWLV